MADAYSSMASLLASYGLGDFAQTLLSYSQQGLDDNSAYLQLQQTPQWKQRFAGNEMLRQRGFAELSPAEYLSVESSYDQLLRSQGLDTMSNRQTFANLIGTGVSPTELKSRIDVATQYVNSTDPATLQALKQYHGLDINHLVSYALDQKNSLPQLQRLSNETQIGAEAIRQGFGNVSGDDISRYASEGVTQQQAAQGFSTIAQILPRMEQLGSIYGQDYNQSTAQQDVIEGLASAQRRRGQLDQLEKANFSGASGVGSSYLHPDYGLGSESAGQF